MAIGLLKLQRVQQESGKGGYKKNLKEYGVPLPQVAMWEIVEPPMTKPSFYSMFSIDRPDYHNVNKGSVD